MATCDRAHLAFLTTDNPRAIEGNGRWAANIPLANPRGIEGQARWNVAPIFVSDTLPPVLNTAFSPVAGTVLRTQAVTIPLMDTQTPQSRVSVVTIWAEYGSGGDEIIYDGSGFHSLFSGLSSISSGAMGTPFVGFTVARTGGWRHASTTIKVYAVDQQGNAALYSVAYTISNPPTGPALNTDFSPSSTATIAASSAVVVPITDAVYNLASLVVYATYGDGTSDIIYNGSSFSSAYSTSSITGGLGTQNASLTLRRNAGWKNAAMSLFVLASDSNGLSASFTATYTVTSPPPGPDSTAPVVSGFLPLTGPLLPADPVFFNVFDNVGFRAIVVMAQFSDGGYEVVHDGTAFTPGYALSTVTVASGNYAYRVARRAGWPLSTPENPITMTIHVVAIDTSGNQAT